MNMKIMNTVVSWVLLSASSLFAETLYVDVTSGKDSNPGTKDLPLKTIIKAAEQINNSTEDGPSTIKVAPGVYNLTEAVIIQNDRTYTQTNRFTIEATILPDDPEWNPNLMPILFSTAEGIPYGLQMLSGNLKIEISHSTVRGLKFLGHPDPQNWNYSIYRQGKDLDDLLVTQCLFVGDDETISANCAICANGHGVVLDHTIFYGCGIPVIFWNAQGGLSKSNAMRYCIVDGAGVAVWTCQTAEDFEFHHNVITRSKYLWMRPRTNNKTYTIRDCVLTDIELNSGRGNSKRVDGPTGSEITFTEENVIREGMVTLVKADPPVVHRRIEKPKNYLHVIPESPGSTLGAGLFKNSGYDPAVSE